MKDTERMLSNHRILSVFMALLFTALLSTVMAFAQDDPPAEEAPLTIVTQPAAISVLEKDKGVTLRFEAQKGEEEVSYQWFKSADGSTENVEAIEGANESSFSTDVFTEKGIRYYFCVATAGEESVTSDVAAVAYTGLPVLYINTEIPMEEITKDVYVFGNMKLVYEDGTNFAYEFKKEKNGEKKEGIKGRGHSTWQMAKKGYAIKFDKKQSLFGLATAKKWCIIANYADKTLLRNVYASLLANNIFNAEWNPSFHPVEVVWDGVYQGNYILCERNLVGTGRVDVQDISDYTEENIGNGDFVDKNGDEVVDLFDGGFVLEIDSWREAEFWFETEKAKAPVALKDPDEVSEEIQEHVKDLVQTAENVLYSENFKDTVNGWRKYFDENSVIDWFLVNEIARNHDAKDFASIYKFYSPADGKLHYGPIWDFDVGFGNDGEGLVAAVTGWYVKNGYWTARMFEDPLFVKNVIERWNEVKENLYASVEDMFLATASKDSVSAEANFMKWDVLGKDIYHNSAGFEERLTYQSEVDYMRDWLLERIAWIDDALNNSFFISYDLDGGTLAAPNREVFLSEDTEPFILNNPTREGFVFAGWSGTGIEGVSKEVEISDDKQGNKSFKANWKLDIATFDVSFAVSDFVYSGAAQTPDVVVSRDEIVLVANTDYVVNYTDNVDAGEATVTITGIGDYTGELKKTFLIAPKAVILTVNDVSKMYGENDPEFTCTVDGLVERDGAVEELDGVVLSREEGEDLGEYGIIAMVNDESNPNYTVTVESAIFDIVPNTTEITVTVKGEKATFEYDGAEHTVSGFSMVSSLAAYPIADVIFTGNAVVSGTDANTYAMGLASSEFENTSVNFTNVLFTVEDGGLTIEKKSVTVMTGSASKEYDGRPLTNDEASIAGLVGGEVATVMATGSRTEIGSGDNTYSISWDTAKAGNYTVKEELGTLTVEHTNHTYEWVTDKEPTASEAGIKHEECTVCHVKQKEGTVIDPTGESTCEHTFEWVMDKKPTCGEAGTKHEECTVCHAKQKEGTVIDPTGEHVWGEWKVTTEPEVGKAGERKHTCNGCGETKTEIIPALIGYFVTVGADSGLTKGSFGSITITVKRSEDDASCFGHYLGTLIDGNPVNVSAEAGSTIVTISADTLEKLSTGTHTVTVKFDDGQAETKLTINAAAAPANPTAPKTEDNSRMILWVSLLCMSGAVLAALIIIGRKRKVRS